MVYSKKLSGAENRKRSHAKSEAQAKIISKTAKLQTYFRCPDRQPNQIENEVNNTSKNDHSCTVKEDNLSNPGDLILSNNNSTETSKTQLSTESKEIIIHQHHVCPCTKITIFLKNVSFPKMTLPIG
ncbi:uncharacterized protein LOC126555575 isoform X2 [Aphis gossypii]|uniref:uncharacterized protein LOC126555575 isoform X2 n=1 Tax=Aphis gossypii TaxID=80765 RepID=UPI002159A415|nr:uncharacterized protein LOC126555575 isoform X2 [Aphis gossypii]